MTHANIYEKFMIEYDKANITSSYPSLTEYEIATLLDKAYLALISQKLTGNNPRRSSFESDLKTIQDIQPLVMTAGLAQCSDTQMYVGCASNELVYSLPMSDDEDGGAMLYPLQCSGETDNELINVKLVGHDTASKFKVTSTNYPWINTPVAYIEHNTVHVVYDPETPLMSVVLTYVFKPKSFVDNTVQKDVVHFELSDSMAEELINLAIVFATETVESPRLQTKSSILSLES